MARTWKSGSQGPRQTKANAARVAAGGNRVRATRIAQVPPVTESTPRGRSHGDAGGGAVLALSRNIRQWPRQATSCRCRAARREERDVLDRRRSRTATWPGAAPPSAGPPPSGSAMSRQFLPRRDLRDEVPAPVRYLPERTARMAAVAGRLHCSNEPVGKNPVLLAPFLGNDRLGDGADSVPVVGNASLCEVDQKVAAPLTCS